ncbi:MAG: uracil-DNA glycosylase [Zoogloeaceae bacterium]|jgi:uracil-DNA glycosylase family 4|nr:uracil-DNA glycosylase [Zoogloeaceae bacterium]
MKSIETCRDCPRLAAFLSECRAARPGYFARPVPPFGDARARLLIVGLAPGYHGANRTGRPFTGDYAGVLLYSTLHRYGFSSQATSVAADDGLRLDDCRITNAVKCVPPENKPETGEIKTCNRYLAAELAAAPQAHVILALGLVAHGAVLRALALKPGGWKFAHGARHVLPDGRVLHDSYHCSRYNTQTGRLTEPAFHAVFEAIRADLGPCSTARP